MLLRKSGSNGNEQNKCQIERASIFRSISNRHKQASYVRVLVQLRKMEVWRQCQTMLHGYGQLYISWKTWECLCRPCWRCWNKVRHLKPWSAENTTHRQKQESNRADERWSGWKINKTNWSRCTDKCTAILQMEVLLTRKQRTQRCVWLNRKQISKITKNAWGIIKQCWSPNKGSGVRHEMYSLKRSTRSHSLKIMIREYKHLMDSSYIYMVQDLE